MILQTGRMKAWQDPASGVSSAWKQGIVMGWGAVGQQNLLWVPGWWVFWEVTGSEGVGRGLSSTHPPPSQIKHVTDVCHCCV